MSKGVYIGVNGVARKVKNVYIGVSNVARKVKKGYIGVGGVARPFLSSEVEYYGTTTALSTVRCYHSAETVGNYAIFAGGAPLGTKHDTYNKNLVKGTAAAFQTLQQYTGSAKIGNYAIFAGGWEYNYGLTKKVEAYSSALVRNNNATDLISCSQYKCVGTHTNNYAIFAAGAYGDYIHFNHDNEVVAYDSNLTQHNVSKTTLDIYNMRSSLTDNFKDVNGINFNGKAIFYGATAYNTNPNTTEISSQIIIYDNNLTIKNLWCFNHFQAACGAAASDTHLVLCGGMPSPQCGTAPQTVCFNSNLVRTHIGYINTDKYETKGFYKNGTYYFIGGYTHSPEGLSYQFIDYLYDSNFVYSTKESTQDVSGRVYSKHVEIGDYVLNGGGQQGSYAVNYDRVDVYT